MNLKEFIVDSINQSTLQVFSTMLGVELAPGTMNPVRPRGMVPRPRPQRLG